MPIKMSPQAQQRALRALSLMIKDIYSQKIINIKESTILSCEYLKDTVTIEAPKLNIETIYKRFIEILIQVKHDKLRKTILHGNIYNSSSTS